MQMVRPVNGYPEREIRTTPYLARPGDEYFPARRPGTQGRSGEPS